MNRQQFLEAFDRSAIEPGTFDHPAHVRVVWSALQEASLLEAMARVRDGLHRLVRKFGAEGKYHDTITCALVLLIHERAVAHPCATWAEFAGQNPDLLEWNDGALLAPYYKQDTLSSDLARQAFVLPDFLPAHAVAPQGAVA